MAKSGAESNELAKGLTQAKTATAKNPMFFALVLKGATGVLLVDRKKIAGQEIADAKKRSGGTTLVQGLCYGEDGQLIFETPKNPEAAWSAAARKSAQEDAKQTIKAVFRQGRDPDTMPDSVEETDGTAASQDGKNAAERYLKIKSGVGALLPKLIKSNPAAAAVAQRVLDKAQGFADQRDFAQAAALVEQAAKAVAKVLAAGPGPAASAPVPAGKVAVEVLRVELRQVRMQAIKGVTELIAKLKTSGAPQSQAIADVIKKLAMAMPAELEGILQQFDAAMKANDTPGVTRLRGEVQRAAKGWMDFLKVHAKSIAGCENNPWGVEVRIGDPVRNSLKAILAAAR
jgi:hypothetical protein